MAALNLKTRYDLAEELDSWYCPQCLENMPSGESVTYSMRCPKCFDCPACFQHLVTQSKEINGSPMFLFHCHWCHWTSDQSGIMAESTNTLQKIMSDIENNSRLKEMNTKLVTKYRQAASDALKRKENLTRQTRKPTPHAILSKRYVHRSPSISSALTEIGQELNTRRKRDSFHFKNLEDAMQKVQGAPDINLRDLEPQMTPTKTPKELVAYFDPDALPEEVWVYTDRRQEIAPGDIEKIQDGKLVDDPVQLVQISQGSEIRKSLDLDGELLTTTDQRICQSAFGFGSLRDDPSIRSMLRSDLLPIRKALLAKKSRRCSECHRIVIKPHINPCGSPPFQMENVAIKFIPRVQPCFVNWIRQDHTPLAHLVAKGHAYLFLFVANPLDVPCKLRFRPGQSGNIKVTVPEFSINMATFIEDADIGNVVPGSEIAATDDSTIVRDRLGNKVLFKISIATLQYLGVQSVLHSNTLAETAEPPFSCSFECELTFQRPQEASPTQVDFGLHLSIG